MKKLILAVGAVVFVAGSVYGAGMRTHSDRKAKFSIQHPANWKKKTNQDGINLMLKRLSDIVLSSLILLLIAPIMLAVALAVKLSSPARIVSRSVSVKPFSVVVMTSWGCQPGAATACTGRASGHTVRRPMSAAVIG